MQLQTCTLREVRLSDVDALAAINVAVWAQDENFAYRFQHALQYPGDFLKYSRLRYLEYLESVRAGIYYGLVAEVADTTGAAGSGVVAFSFWQLPGDHEKAAKDYGIKPPAPYPERRDANWKRIKVFREVMKKAEKSWFGDVYGKENLWLITLAVLPEFQQRGIGTAILEWGIEEAWSQRLPMVLFTSKMGKHLYLKYGFRTVGTAPVQVKGEDEVYTLEGMAREVIY